MLKTNKGAAKRLRVTGSGKVKHKKAFLRHILTNKTAKNKRQLRSAGLLDKADVKEAKRLLPYSF
ncbi:MAG: 50S ribosomal protein L35 [Nitrospinae bacterium]|nr:50S ribosomal protein L35 [Nitrospinota bacterium]